MMDRYVPPEMIAAAEREAIKKRFSKPSVYFDPEFFMSGYDALTAEFDATDREGRRRMLTERYFDGFAPVYDKEIEHSQFQDRFLINVPANVVLASMEIAMGAEPEWTGNAFGRMQENAGYSNARVWQQGPTRAYDMHGIGFIQLESLGRQDVLGIPNLRICSAVVARDGNRVFLGRVYHSNPDTMRTMLIDLRDRGYKPDQTRILAPFWKREDGSTVDSWNRRIEEVSETHGIRLDWFPRIGGAAWNPDKILKTAVLVGRDALWSVGTNINFRRQENHGDPYLQNRTVIHPKTYRDYE